MSSLTYNGILGFFFYEHFLWVDFYRLYNLGIIW